MAGEGFRAGAACAALALCAPVVAAAEAPRDALSAYGDETPAPPKRFGLMFDVGSVEGGMLSLIYRPVNHLRLEGGAGTNSVSPGFRVGAVVLPGGSWPTISLSGGHFFAGDINGVARLLSTGAYRHNRRLEHFDYDFLSLHLGWEKEAMGLLFFAQGGASLLWTELPAGTSAASPSSAARVTDEAQPFWLILPSLRLGFIGFL